eukprot:jgi/Astpho2/8275/Aster-01358
MWKAGLCLLAAATLAAAQNRDLLMRDLQAVSVVENVNLLYPAQYGPGTLDLPATYPGAQRTVSGLLPDQVHLTYLNGTAVVISWATGAGAIGNATTPTTPLAGWQTVNGPFSSIVQIGTKPGVYTNNATGYTTNYTQTYTGFLLPNGTVNASQPNYNYTSPLFNHVTVGGLVPGTTYYYSVGNPTQGFSTPYNFTAPPATGSYPLRFGVVADIGFTINSTITLQNLFDDEPEVFTLVGDWIYADDHNTIDTSCYYSNGTAIISGLCGSPYGTYQPRWDWFHRTFSYLFSSIPVIPNSGNHELEPQYSGQSVGNALLNNQSVPNSQFQSYLNRYPLGLLTTQANSVSASNLYYSVNVGPVHMVVLSNYVAFAKGSPQYNWLVKDLQTYNRTATPWLVAQWHAPWYSTYTSHYKENECMREAMEPIFYAAGVDIALLGHLHAYERTNPVYNYNVNQCGTVHITMGDGGNIEGLYQTYVDQPGACPYNATTAKGSVATYQPGGYCPSFTYNASDPATNGGFCPTSQPAWSAFRQPAFGHGILTFENSTHALWQWNRNVDALPVELDSIYIIRDTTCANKNNGALNAAIQSVAAAPAPAPSSSASLAAAG